MTNLLIRLTKLENTVWNNQTIYFPVNPDGFEASKTIKNQHIKIAELKHEISAQDAIIERYKDILIQNNCLPDYLLEDKPEEEYWDS